MLLFMASALSTQERILEGTIDALSQNGLRRLSMAAVARAAGVSRPTLYRWFPSTEALLDALGPYEQSKFDAGIAAAIADVDEADRLDAVLRFVVEFQHSYSLRRMVDVEPEHVLRQMNRVLPTVRDRMLPLFPGADGFARASAVTRIALSHSVIPDGDPDLFLAEMRLVAGLDHRGRAPRRRHALAAGSRTSPEGTRS